MKLQKHSLSSVNLGIVGATGLVGQEFLKLLDERKFKLNELFLFASDNSNGKKLKFRDNIFHVLPFKENLFSKIDIAFFSAGADMDKVLVPKAVKHGTICIDNSSAFRMVRNIPLIVPEINFKDIKKNDKIIANPNCSTIQLVLVLDILRSLSKIVSVDISTYQAVSGAGREFLEMYVSQSKKKKIDSDPQFYENIIHSIGTIYDSGYCEEEMKIVNETRKILKDSKIMISPTTMRVPLSRVHTESVAVEFQDAISISRVRNIFEKNNNDVILIDEMDSNKAENSNITFVSRLRMDIFNRKKFLMIITADNLRVGAALNGIRIAERIVNEKNN